MKIKSIFWIFAFMLIIQIAFGIVGFKDTKIFNTNIYQTGNNSSINFTGTIDCSNVTGSNVDLCNINITGGNGTFSYPSGEIINVTYSEFVNLINTENLTKDSGYRITDFQTDYTIPNTADSFANLYGVTEVLIVTAINSTAYNPIVYSESYPQDIIQWTHDNAISGYDGATKGAILYRKDQTENIEVGYDWRVAKYRRWETIMPSIGATSFTGTGTDNLRLTGTYNNAYNNLSYKVEIDGTGTYRYSNDGGSTWLEEGVAISSTPHASVDGFGIYFYFINDASDTVGDYWTFDATYSPNGVYDQYYDTSGGIAGYQDFQSINYQFGGIQSRSVDLSATNLMSNIVFKTYVIDIKSGNSFQDNDFASQVENVNVGSNFKRNLFKSSLVSLSAGYSFSDNMFYSDCTYNVVGDNFRSNTFKDSFTTNFITSSNFQNNYFNGRLNNAFISANNFNDNYVFYDFSNNKIFSSEFINNIIYGNFYGSIVTSDYFGGNYIGFGNDFWQNKFTAVWNANTFPDKFQTTSFYYNEFNGNFDSKTINLQDVSFDIKNVKIFTSDMPQKILDTTTTIDGGAFFDGGAFNGYVGVLTSNPEAYFQLGVTSLVSSPVNPTYPPSMFFTMNSPSVLMENHLGTTDDKLWDFGIGLSARNNEFEWRSLNDANTMASQWLVAHRPVGDYIVDYVSFRSGRIGINTSDDTLPSAQLEVVGNASITGELYSNGSQVCTYANGGNCYNGTVLNQTINTTLNSLVMTKVYKPYNISCSLGTTTGNITDILTLDDDKYFNVTESVGATPALNCTVKFTNVTNMNRFVMREYYIGIGSDDITVSILECLNGYEIYDTLHGQTGYVYNPYQIPDASTHICADGNVTMQFLHTTTGKANHLFSLDYLALEDGFESLPPDLSQYSTTLQDYANDSAELDGALNGTRNATFLNMNITNNLTVDNVLYIDSTRRKVSIGSPTTATSYILDVYANVSNGFRVTTNSSSPWMFDLFRVDLNKSWRWYVDGNGELAYFYFNGTISKNKIMISDTRIDLNMSETLRGSLSFTNSTGAIAYTLGVDSNNRLAATDQSDAFAWFTQNDEIIARNLNVTNAPIFPKNMTVQNATGQLWCRQMLNSTNNGWGTITAGKC